jgi:integrase/recombinase XerD
MSRLYYLILLASGQCLVLCKDLAKADSTCSLPVGRKERIIYVHTYTRKSLNKYIKFFRERICISEPIYLFPAKDGEYISVNCIQKMIRRLAIRAGLRDIKCHPHLFRNAFATRFLAKGGAAEILQEILGHKSFQTTRKYVHPQQDDIKKQHK